ncbi:unnamed protein product [Clonostachys rosea]|uniref:C2H2-type domain-containing protein n=1 Tax=Bionectria ochroleuca TaxID=29856 RepID=A0ABY6TMH7_BIOOC|nr:unnamed protein product [Clonostachys rosea]
MTEAAATQPHVNWSEDPVLNDFPPKSPLMKESELRGSLSRTPPPQNSFPPPCFRADDDDDFCDTPKGGNEIHPGEAFLIRQLDNNRSAAIAQNAAVAPLPPIRSASSECDRESLYRREPIQRTPPQSHSKPKEQPPTYPGSLENLAANALRCVYVDSPRVPESPFTKDISTSTFYLSIQDKESDLVNSPTNDFSTVRKQHVKTEKLSSPPVSTPDSAGLPPISPRTSEANSQTLPSIRTTFADMDLLLKGQGLHNGPGSGSSPGFTTSLHPHPFPRLASNHGKAPISPPDSYQASPQALSTTSSYLAPSATVHFPKQLTEQEAIEELKFRKRTSTISIPIPLSPASIPHHEPPAESAIAPASTYVCTFAGCKAPPFQTQYLLNSHANVHSSARPHYCPVQGCPRSEGGKGFKRKNEMIRHGLVHDSPGYVCPFCPDRDHRYPRPDNLQRHVRVHHSDKNKDDPQLRNVLAQRADGPNRGRRRRGLPL